MEREEIVKAFQRSLVDFGYNNISPRDTEIAIQRALDGSYDGDVIASFVHGWLHGEYSRLLPICQELFSDD